MIEKLKSYYNLRGLNYLLIGVAVIATLMVLFNGWSAYASYSDVKNKLARFSKPAAGANEKNKESLASSVVLVGEVDKMRFMDIKDQVPQFRAQLTGIFGSQAFFAGQDTPKSVGEQINGGTIKEVNADSVVVEFQGKPVTLNVFADAGGGMMGGGGPGGDMSGGPGRFGGFGMRGGGGPGGGGRMGGFGGMMAGGEMTPEAIQQLVDRAREMSPDEQEAFISRFERRDPNAAAKIREMLKSSNASKQ